MNEHAATPADVGALINARGNDGWCGNGMYGIIGLLAILGIFGGGFGGWGNRNGGDVLTTAESCNMNSFNELKSQVGRMNDMMFQEARASDNATCTLGYQGAQHANDIMSLLNQCCCQIKQLVQDEGNATRSMLQQDKYEAVVRENADLKMDKRFCGVPRVPTNWTYAVNPASLFGYSNSCNNNCNCGNNPLF